MSGSFDYGQVVVTVERVLRDRAPGADVNLGPFLRELTDEILASSGPGDRTELTHSHPRSSPIAAANAGPIGLIVGELVANAVHYAHPAGVSGRIDVSSSASAADGASSIEVRDDGVGLPEQFNCLVDGGAGLEAVRALADQLGGSLHFNDRGIGLSVRLDLPGPRRAGPRNVKALS